MKNNKKGFTIVELVIVIAVIAILAAVLIPTFSSVISKANESSALSKAQNALQIITVTEAQVFNQYDYYFVTNDGYVFEYKKGTTSGLVKSSITEKQLTDTNSKIASEYASASAAATTSEAKASVASMQQNITYTATGDVASDLSGLNVTIYKAKAGTTIA